MGGAERVGRRIKSEVRWDQSHHIPLSSHQALKNYFADIFVISNINVIKNSRNTWDKMHFGKKLPKKCSVHILGYIPGKVSDGLLKVSDGLRKV